MERSRPEYLVGKLLSNNLSREEFDELLAGLGETEMSPEYSGILEEYFNKLMSEHDVRTPLQLRS
ncbi:hypothetical protein [Runella sp. SP2]|uniref:hypothetical protein n=1 Tax=Runella sp. SP2 TaxID=2268026 RepID=UPI000F089B20|nr:hypothetical protein [Runella sp. SP2]AYQ36424.1 hypothetical protein DTQ70_21020 [Runella sp. SP2]